MGGVGKTSTSTSQVQIPPDVLARYNSVNAQAQNVAATPFQQYSTNPNAFVAPLTATQQAGIAATGQYANAAQPYYQQAADLTTAGAGAVNPEALNINQYMSPYLQNVAQSEANLLNQNNQQAMAGQLGNAISSGAFGGDRAGIAAANLNQQNQLANANIYSNILNTGYNTALQTAAQQQGVDLSAQQANLARMSSAGAQLGNLGTAAQTAGLAGANAELAAGQVQQQTQQAGLSALYNQFLQQQSYPFQVAQFLAGIAEGTGALSGSTTTTTQPQSFFSDENLKEDIEDVGRTHDGQKIIRFRYKGEDKTAPKRIGLLAQDVEKHHPEAVGLAGGYKAVDYDRALESSASMGGAVGPQHAGLGFAQGGAPKINIFRVFGDEGPLSDVLQEQRQQLQNAMVVGRNRPMAAHYIDTGPTPGLGGTNPYLTGDPNPWKEAAARGGLMGRHHYAIGGGEMPYQTPDGMVPTRVNIPLGSGTPPKLAVSNVPIHAQPSGLQQLGQGVSALKGGLDLYKEAKDLMPSFSSDYTADPRSYQFPSMTDTGQAGGPVARGGWLHRADGGDIPYEDSNDPKSRVGLDIPNDTQQHVLIPAANPTGRPTSGLGQLASGLSAANNMMNVGNGLYGAATTDIPQLGSSLVGLGSSAAGAVGSAASSAGTAISEALPLLALLSSGGSVDREHHATGGLAGRYHYADGGGDSDFGSGPPDEADLDSIAERQDLKSALYPSGLDRLKNAMGVGQYTGQQSPYGPIYGSDYAQRKYNIENMPDKYGNGRIAENNAWPADRNEWKLAAVRNRAVPVGIGAQADADMSYFDPISEKETADIWNVPGNRPADYEDREADRRIAMQVMARSQQQGFPTAWGEQEQPETNIPEKAAPQTFHTEMRGRQLVTVPDAPTPGLAGAQSAAPTDGGSNILDAIGSGLGSVGQGVGNVVGGVGNLIGGGKGDQGGGISGWFDRNQNWIVPGLSFLGGMASSPSRYLGSAILQGLGQAGQSYENVQNRMTQRNEQIARAAETYAGIPSKALIHTVDGRIFVPTVNAGGGYNLTGLGDYMEAQRSGNAPQIFTGITPRVNSQNVETGGANIQPAQRPTGIAPKLPVNYSEFYDENDANSAKKEGVDLQNMPGYNKAIDTSYNYDADTRKNAESASGMRRYSQDAAMAVANLGAGRGLNTAGSGANTRASVLNFADTVARAFGAGDNYFSSTPTGENGLPDNAAILHKVETLRSNVQQNMGGSQALAALESYMSANPNAEMPPKVAREIVSQMLIEEQIAMDQRAHAAKWRADSGGTEVGAQDAFRNKVSTGMYNKDKEDLKAMMEKAPNTFNNLINPNASPDQIKDALSKGGFNPRLIKYFTRGVQ